MKVISVIHDEFKTIAGSYAILLVLMGGIFVYGLLYNYMYAPDLVRKVPVAVVDHSHSELGRHYVRLLDATPQVNVVTTATDYPEAQDMMKAGQVAGILYLPDDFEDRVAVVKSLFSSCTETTERFPLLPRHAGSFGCFHVGSERRLPAGDVGVLASTGGSEACFGPGCRGGRDCSL